MFPDFWWDGGGPDPENDGYLPDVEVIIINDRLAFLEMPIAHQRDMKNMPLPSCEGQLRTTEEEREVFELINFEGFPQGESDSTEQ